MTKNILITILLSFFSFSALADESKLRPGSGVYEFHFFNVTNPAGFINAIETFDASSCAKKWRDEYLEPLVQGEIFPSFAMTEPDISSSDPTQLQTTAILEGDEWVINGTKWFTTGAARAAYTTVMCRTEVDVPSHGAFSMIIVPTDNPGYKIVRETPVLGINGGHYEVNYDNVRVPKENLLGPRGQGFLIAQRD